MSRRSRLQNQRNSKSHKTSSQIHIRHVSSLKATSGPSGSDIILRSRALPERDCSPPRNFSELPKESRRTFSIYGLSPKGIVYSLRPSAVMSIVGSPGNRTRFRNTENVKPFLENSWKQGTYTSRSRHCLSSSKSRKTSFREFTISIYAPRKHIHI